MSVYCVFIHSLLHKLRSTGDKYFNMKDAYIVFLLAITAATTTITTVVIILLLLLAQLRFIRTQFSYLSWVISRISLGPEEYIM